MTKDDVKRLILTEDDDRTLEALWELYEMKVIEDFKEAILKEKTTPNAPTLTTPYRDMPLTVPCRDTPLNVPYTEFNQSHNSLLDKDNRS